MKDKPKNMEHVFQPGDIIQAENEPSACSIESSAIDRFLGFSGKGDFYGA
jgi:hypothetical protein